MIIPSRRQLTEAEKADMIAKHRNADGFVRCFIDNNLILKTILRECLAIRFGLKKIRISMRSLAIRIWSLPRSYSFKRDLPHNGS